MIERKFYLAVLVLILLLVGAAVAFGGEAAKSFDKPQPAGTEAVCPVTGDSFTIGADTPFSEFNGRYYYFCCAACKPEFDANPAKFSGENKTGTGHEIPMPGMPQ